MYIMIFVCNIMNYLLKEMVFYVLIKGSFKYSKRSTYVILVNTSEWNTQDDLRRFIHVY